MRLALRVFLPFSDYISKSENGTEMAETAHAPSDIKQTSCDLPNPGIGKRLRVGNNTSPGSALSSETM